MIAAFVFLFGIHTHKMIEFHKVDEFWAICCVFDPSINSSENSQHQSNGFLYTNIEWLASSHSMRLWFNFNKRWIVERTLKPDFTFGCESFHRKYPWIDSKWILNDCKRFWKWLLEMFIGVTSTNWLCFFLLKHWKTPLEVRNIELIIWNSWSHHERWTFFLSTSSFQLKCRRNGTASGWEWTSHILSPSLFQLDGTWSKRRALSLILLSWLLSAILLINSHKPIINHKFLCLFQHFNSQWIASSSNCSSS